MATGPLTGRLIDGRYQIEELIGEENKLVYTGRVALSAPAVGYARLHVQHQTELVNKALGLETP